MHGHLLTSDWLTTAIRCIRSLIAGRLEETEELALAALNIGQATSQPDAATVFTAHLFQIRALQGRWAELEQLSEAAVAAIPGLPAATAALALLYCELHRYDEARALFEELAADDFTLHYDLTWFFGIAYSTEACARLDDRVRAEVLYKLLAPYRSQFVAAVALYWMGSVAHYLGLLAAVLGRLDDADTHFAEAADAHTRMEAPAFLARTQVEWAKVLVTRDRRGDREHAIELVGQALITAKDFDLGAIENRALALRT